MVTKLKPTSERPMVYVLTITLGLKGTWEQIEKFHNSIKRIAAKVDEEEFFGSIRVFTESADGEKWELKMVTPPVPKNHLIVGLLKGVMITAYEDKRVITMQHDLVKAKFNTIQ